jgi:O-antigen ligase
MLLLGKDKAENYWRLVLLALPIFFLLLLSDFKSPLLVLFLLLAYLLTVFAYFNPYAGLIGFIVLRSSVDFLTDRSLLSIGTATLNYPGLLSLLVIIILATVLWRNRSNLKLPTLFGRGVLYFTLAGLSFFSSINHGDSLSELARLSGIAALFWLGFLLVKNKKQLTTIIKTIILTALIPSLVALWQIISNTGLWDGINMRAYGTFGHPNMLAYYLVFIIILTLSIALKLNYRRVEPYAYLFLALFYSLILVFTYTRGAYICLIAAILAIGLLRYRFVLISFAIIFTAFYFLITPFSERIDSLLRVSAGDSTLWRISLWQDGLSYAKNRPWSGYGIGTAADIISDNRPNSMGSTEPHNDYLKVLLETGLPGLLAFVWLVLGVIFKLWQGYRQKHPTRLQNLFLFCLLFFIPVSIMAGGDNLLKDTVLQWNLWCLLGALFWQAHLITQNT